MKQTEEKMTSHARISFKMKDIVKMELEIELPSNRSKEGKDSPVVRFIVFGEEKHRITQENSSLR